MTFIVCPSNNVFEMYLRSLKLKKEERINYQRLTEVNQLRYYSPVYVIIIGNENHQYFSFTKTVRILEEIKACKELDMIKEVKNIKNF